ncbi:MAG TPA: M1 family aminopeptidase [Thermoanaerobaculia bacterium]|nr:M1 family aminopeptidase [Thermoanaerobaculia bacterium]
MPKSIALFAVAIALSAASLQASEVPQYQQMRAARPDGRSAAVSELTLARDAYRLHFTAGTFHFLTPLGERTWGAVFLGEGEWQLRPAVENERRQLALVTGRNDLEVLSDRFDAMVLLFSDATFEEILANGAGVAAGAADARAVQVYETYLEEQRRWLQVNLHLRVLQELLNEPAARGDVFLAFVDGKDQAPAVLVFDRHGIGAMAARFGDLSGEETALISLEGQNGGFWYLAPAMEGARNSTAPRRVLDAKHYRIETTITPDLGLKGTTAIELEAIAPGVRVIPIHILPKIRLRRAWLVAADGSGEELGIIQEEVDLGRFARLFRAEVADADAAVVLPRALEPGKPMELLFEYDGRDVLERWGAESYSVRARESWYPNLGTFVDTATYELTYRYPKRKSLVSTGVLSGEVEEGKNRVAVWKSERPMRIAGFNYGTFRKVARSDEQSGVHVEVFTARDRRKFAGDAMADALNAARVARAFFGPAPYASLAVTQQVESFGQSWPSLIYLPTLALTSSTERVMALESAGPAAITSINEFAKTVGWHEVAHQWWGHAVGWQSYRDVWLSEGFSEFTSALVLQFIDGDARHDQFWERRRREILQPARGAALAHNDAGPISQSFRLQTRRTRGAANAIIYAKGGYVLHMLRVMMRDNGAALRGENYDARFIAMMQDYVSEYAWKSPSTDDFRRIVERHMTPQMNAAGDGRMAWFFDQWVHGTEVPRFASTLEAQPLPEGKYRIRGTVSQEDVSAGFLSVVPIYADFGKDRLIPIGSIRLEGTESAPVDVEMTLPWAPRRIVVNARQDVLARDVH